MRVRPSFFAVNRLRASGGFSFVEVIVVTAIVFLLASVAMPMAQVTVQRQREVELRRTLREMRTAVDRFKDAVDQGLIPTTELKPGSEGYPPDLETLVEGVAAANDASGRKLKFLRRVPTDPMTKSTEWGLRAYQDNPDGTRWGGQNVFDVYTTSDAPSSTPLPPDTVADAPPPPRRSYGFTLIELMIVMGLIVTLAGVGLAMYGNSVTRAREAALKEDLFRMRDAIDQYYADKHNYPPSLDALVSEKYLRAVPADPFTNAVDTWQVTLSEPEPGNPSAEPGVYNVTSGSDRTGIDGTAYAEW
jgi:general secretion pathway protein G